MALAARGDADARAAVGADARGCSTRSAPRRGAASGSRRWPRGTRCSSSSSPRSPARRSATVGTLSGSIRGVLHARLDRLDQEERAVLERASVVGRSFSLEAVLELIPPEERELAQARMFELVAARADPARRRGSRRTASASSTRSSATRSTRRCRRRLRADLHETVAAQLDDAGDAAPALVGFHLEQACLLRRELGRHDAELAQRAGRLLRLAAEETLSRTDAPATISLLERARALLPTTIPSCPPLLTALGVARGERGRHARRRIRARRGGRGRRRARRPRGGAARTHRAPVRPRVRRRARRSRRASSSPGRRSPELEPLGDELALARAWWLASSGDIAACRWRERGEAIERALEHARRARAGVDMVGTLAGLLAQALLHGPTPVERGDRARRKASGRARARRAAAERPSTRASPGCSRCSGDSRRRGGCTGTRRQRTRSSGCASAAQRRRSSARRSSCSPATPPRAERQLRASSAAFDEIGATTSATTHRALLAEVFAGSAGSTRPRAGGTRRRRSARRGPRRPGALAVRTRAALAHAKAGATRRAPRPRRSPSARASSSPARVAALKAAAEVERPRTTAPRPAAARRGRSIAEAKGTIAQHRALACRSRDAVQFASASCGQEAGMTAQGERARPRRARGAQPRRTQPRRAQPRRAQARGTQASKSTAARSTTSLEEHGEPKRTRGAETTRRRRRVGRRVAGSERKPLPGARRAGAVARDAQVEVTVLVRPRAPIPVGRRRSVGSRCASAATSPAASTRPVRRRPGKDLAAVAEFAARARAARPAGERGAAKRRPRRNGRPDGGRVRDEALPLPLSAGRRTAAARATCTCRARSSRRSRPSSVSTTGRRRRRTATSSPGARRAGAEDLVHADADRRAVRLPAPPRRKRPAHRRDRARRRLPPLAAAPLLRRSSEADAEVTAVSVDGARNRPGVNHGADGEVLLDVEVIGAVAPGAEQLVYFAPMTDRGFVDAVTTARLRPARSRRSSRSAGGRPRKSGRSRHGVPSTRRSRPPPLLGITVCAASGDNGWRDGVAGGVAHVDYPGLEPVRPRLRRHAPRGDGDDRGGRLERP